MSHKKKRHFPANASVGLATAKAVSSKPTTLEDLLADELTVLYVHSIDVARLKDDEAPIQVGEELMFVAKAVIQLLHTGVSAEHLAELGLAAPCDLFEIGADADLISEVEIDSDDAVAKLLAQNFGFAFNFKVNGEALPTSYEPTPGDPPWVFRFDTSVYPTDFLKVDVDIKHDAPPETTTPAPAPAAPPKERRFRLTDAAGTSSLVLAAKVPNDFHCGEYLLPLHHEDPSQPSLWLRSSSTSNDSTNPHQTEPQETSMAIFKVNQPRVTPVSLTRTAHPITSDLALWAVIRNSCTQLKFSAYREFIDDVMCAGTMKKASVSKDTAEVTGHYKDFVNDPSSPHLDPNVTRRSRSCRSAGPIATRYCAPRRRSS